MCLQGFGHHSYRLIHSLNAVPTPATDTVVEALKDKKIHTTWFITMNFKSFEHKGD
jgi:hypothetical protein